MLVALGVAGRPDRRLLRAAVAVAVGPRASSPEANIGNLVQASCRPTRGSASGSPRTSASRRRTCSQRRGWWRSRWRRRAASATIWWLRRRRDRRARGRGRASVLLYLVVRATRVGIPGGEGARRSWRRFPMLLGARALLAPTRRCSSRADGRARRGRRRVRLRRRRGRASSRCATPRSTRAPTSASSSRCARCSHDRDVLFLGFDDYIGWRLFGARVTDPPVQDPVLPYQLRKPFADGGVAGLRLGHPRHAGPLRLRGDDADRVREPAARATSRACGARASYEVYRRGAPHARQRPARRRRRAGRRRWTARASGRPAADARRAGGALVRPAPVLVQAPPGDGRGLHCRRRSSSCRPRVAGSSRCSTPARRS